jgi:hypothetical protein
MLLSHACVEAKTLMRGECVREVAVPAAVDICHLLHAYHLTCLAFSCASSTAAGPHTVFRTHACSLALCVDVTIAASHATHGECEEDRWMCVALHPPTGMYLPWPSHHGFCSDSFFVFRHP